MNIETVLQQRCPTECDPDCAQVCHEVHFVAMKREHEMDECPGVLFDLLAGLYF